jgi:NADH dehydrogenase
MQKVILVAGGTGFIGRRVVEFLQKKGYRVIVHSREQKTVPTHADVVVNCVGIIREDEQDFKDAHVEFTQWLVRLAKKLKVEQYVQLSALGAELESTPYQRTKRAAEKIVEKSGLPYAIVRPSVVFGPGDKSINLFRKISRTGFFPVMADGKLQPVHADVVAQVIVAAAERRVRNRTVEVGGPEVFNWRSAVQRVHPGVITLRVPRWKLPLITWLGKWFKTLPTKDMLTMMRQDNVVKKNVVDRLGIRNVKLS